MLREGLALSEEGCYVTAFNLRFQLLQNSAAGSAGKQKSVSQQSWVLSTMAAVIASLKSVDFYRKLKKDLQQVSAASTPALPTFVTSASPLGVSAWRGL